MVKYEGLYIDNLRISYAAPVVPAVACYRRLVVVGNVFDANTYPRWLVRMSPTTVEDQPQR